MTDEPAESAYLPVRGTARCPVKRMHIYIIQYAYIYIYIHMRIHIYIYMYMHMFRACIHAGMWHCSVSCEAYTCIRIYAYIYIYIYVYTYLYVYAYIQSLRTCTDPCPVWRIHMYIFKYTYIHIYIYTCIYKCINTDAYIYTGL